MTDDADFRGDQLSFFVGCTFADPLSIDQCSRGKFADREGAIDNRQNHRDENRPSQI
jgi:hypothetical protein